MLCLSGFQLYSRWVPLISWPGTEVVSTFCPPQCCFFRVGVSEAKKKTLGGEEHNFLSEYGYSTRVSQLHKPETQAQ